MGPGHRDFKSGTTASLRASERAALVSGHSAAGLRPFPAQDSAHRTLVPTEDADAGGHCPPSSSSHHRVARYSHPHLSSAEGQVPLSVLSVEEQRRFEARDLPGRAIRRDRAVLCFDADCFYAQVEEAREPALRGAPLGVTQKNIIVTCNYAARAEGVTKLMPIGRALARCPGLALRSGEDLTHYRAASARITDCLAGSLAGGGDGEGLNALSELDAAGAVPSPALLERQGLDEVFMDATAPARALLGTDGVQRWRASLRSRCLHEGREMPTTDALASALAPAHSVEWPPGGERARAAARALAARILGASDCGVRARVHAAAAVGCPSEGGVGAWTGSVESDDNGDDAKESEEEEEEGEEDFVEGDDPLLRGRAEAAPQPPAAAARETDSDALLVAADVIAACARRRVRRTLGLTLCAGVGHSKLLAKFAVNMKKPGAQSLLHASAVGPFLLTLPLRRVPGVGGATARRLAGAFGAHAVRDLLPIALPRIAAELGDRAARLVYLAARGIDDTAVTPSQAPRSISVEDSFKRVADMGSVREYMEALAAVLMDRVLADSAAHARAPQRLAVRLRHARQRSTTRQQPCPAAVRAAALAHRRDSAAGGSHPRSSVEAARAAVVRAAMGLLRAELSGPFHLTLLGVGCSQFAGLGGAAAAVPASPDAPACAPSAPGPRASAAADSRVPSARTRGRDKERGATAASGEGTPRKRQRGIAAYFGGSR